MITTSSNEIRYADDNRYPGPAAHPLPSYIKGTPSQSDLDSYPRMFTWYELKEIIRSGKLERLMRNKGMQGKYDVWMQGMKREYGSTERYLKQARLPWVYTEDTTITSLAQSVNDQSEAPIGRAAIGSSATSGISTPSSAGFVSLDDIKLRDTLFKTRLGDGNGHANAEVDEAINLAYLRYDPAVSFDRELYAVLPNDWPYCTPYGVRHFCVWSKVPIAHPSQVDYDPSAWSIIEQEGLSGFTGVVPLISLSAASSDPSKTDYIHQTVDRATPPADPVEPITTPHIDHGLDAAGEYAVDIAHGGYEARRWAGVHYQSVGGEEVGRMVRGLWDERGWECLWFVNPPRLQSVPGLSHFHVFARRKTPVEIDATEQAVSAGALRLVTDA